VLFFRDASIHEYSVVLPEFLANLGNPDPTFGIEREIQ
jgi:hypothetical protein